MAIDKRGEEVGAMKQIILFDGECIFCHWGIQFIMKRDPHAIFLFAPLHSEHGQTLLHQYSISKTEDSIVLLADNHYYVQSTAVLKIARKLQAWYPLLYLFMIIPRPLRDAVYRLIAKKRYKWFGKKDSCMIPSHDERKRFLIS